MSKPLWREPSPFFYAWCEEANRIDAFGAALSALVAGGRLDLSMSSPPPSYNAVTPEEAVAALRSRFVQNPHDSYHSASFRVTLTSGRFLDFSSYCHNEVMATHR